MQALRSTWWLAGRSLLLVRRLPSVFIPSLVMPLFILVATAGAFHGNGSCRSSRDRVISGSRFRWPARWALASQESTPE